MPVRIQRKRTKGWKMPAGASYVGRGGAGCLWGNPFKIGAPGPLGRVACDAISSVGFFRTMMSDPQMRAAAAYPPDDAIRFFLGGKDLACWCPLDQPCHADVLLHIANREE